MNTLEQSIIGAIFREPALLDTAANHAVTVETFADPAAREIFAACQTLTAKGVPDLVLLGTDYPHLIDDAANAFASVPTTVHFPDWIAEAKDLEARREITRICQKVLTDAQNPEITTNAICGDIEAGVSSTLATTRGRRCQSLQEAARAIVKDLESGPPPIIPLFPSNTEAGRKIQMHPGELWIIGAATGTGKTALAAGMTCNILDAGRSVVYFCTESSTAEIYRRIAAAWSGVPHYAKDPGQRMTLAKGVQELYSRFQRKLHICGNEGGTITPGAIRRKLREIEATDGPADVVIVDFIQNMKPDKPARSKLEESDKIVQGVHDTLLEFRIAGLVLAQFNRQSQTGAAAGNGGTLPDLTWLKDTSTLEQLAHTVAFLAKDSNDISRFYSKKERNCPRFAFKLRWDGTQYLSMDEASGTP